MLRVFRVVLLSLFNLCERHRRASDVKDEVDRKSTEFPIGEGGEDVLHECLDWVAGKKARLGFEVAQAQSHKDEEPNRGETKRRGVHQRGRARGGIPGSINHGSPRTLLTHHQVVWEVGLHRSLLLPVEDLAASGS